MVKGDKISRDSFLKGAFVLGIAGVFVRLIGGFFRIPLGNILSLDAMGYYSAAYPVYSLFVVLSTAGLPTAIAKRIAEHRALGEQRNITTTFKAGLILMSAVGLFGFLVVWFGADAIIRIINNPGARLSLLALSPGILLVSVMSVFRGYFQGYQLMTPFALSQIVEQIGRVVVGYTLAVTLISVGAEAAAAGATFGATAGAAIGLVLIVVSYYLFTRKPRPSGGEPPCLSSKERVVMKTRNFGSDNISSSLSTALPRHDRAPLALGEVVRRILAIAVPITLGASILPLMGIVDVSQIMNRLTAIGMAETANELYSMYSAYAITIINLPQSLTMAIQISIVPAIAAYAAVSAKKELAALINNALRITLILMLPATAGIVLLATPIIQLMYPARMDVSGTIGGILAILGPCVLFLGLFQTTTGILQGMNRPLLPAFNMLIAVLFKVAANHILVGIPALNIYGAALSSVITYIVAFALNYRSLRANLDFRLDLRSLFEKPLLCVAVMSAAVWILQSVLGMFLGRIATVASVFGGIAVYLLMIFWTRTLSDEDYAMIPGGSKLKRLEDKLFKRR